MAGLLLLSSSTPRSAAPDALGAVAGGQPPASVIDQLNQALAGCRFETVTLACPR